MVRKNTYQQVPVSGSYMGHSSEKARGPIYDGVVAKDMLDGSAEVSQELLGCPVCGYCEYRNIHKERWGVCPEHHTKWALGFDCTSYCYEPPAVWEQNMLNMADYRNVTPVPCASFKRSRVSSRTTRNRA